MFFFCKQKTAYDLRISDWSSDVCSSDLVGAARIDGAGESLDRGEGEFGEAAALDIVDQAVGDVGSGLEPVDHQRPEILGSGARLAGKRLDRKSVESGKSVSVRVDLGGRRSFNKKNQFNHD